MAQNLPNTSRSNLGSLLGVMSFLAALLIYNFFTRGVSADIAAAREQVETLEAQNLQVQQEISEFTMAQDSLESSNEVALFDVLTKIPTEINQDQIIRDLTKLSGENDIALNSVSFGKGNSVEEGIGSLRVNASFQGSFSDFVNFLKGLEANPRFVKVNSVSVQLSSVTAFGVRTASFSLSMEAFYQL